MNTFSIMKKLKLRKYTILLLFCFFYNVSNAQTIKLTEATHQGWSGGNAGRYGAKYYFTILCKDFKEEPKLDKIWIENSQFNLVVRDSIEIYGNVKRSKRNNTLQYTITVGTSHDEYAEKNFPKNNSQKQEKEPKPPIKFSGLALISYHYKGVEKYFIINKTLTELEPINYP